MKLFAPIIPFVTEEVYQKYFRENERTKSIHLSEWPSVLGKQVSANGFTFFCDLLEKIRKVKSDEKKSMNAEIILTLDKKEIEKLEEMIGDLKNVTNAKEIKEGKFNVEFA
jgi:valyl-tRNA synthetase